MNAPYRPRPANSLQSQYGGVPFYSQGAGLYPPETPLFSQGEGTGGLPQTPGPGGPAGPGAPPPGMPQGKSGISMADAAAITGLNQLGAERGNVERQRKLADMLRTSGQAGMQGQQAGRVYRAPGALNLMGSLASSFGGAYLDDQAKQQALNIGQREARGAKDIFSMLRGGGGDPGTPGSTLQGPPEPPIAPFKQQGFGDWLKGSWQGLWGGGGG